MLVYFLLPLLLAVAHSACAMCVVADVVELFGRFEIGATAAFVAACFLPHTDAGLFPSSVQE